MVRHRGIMLCGVLDVEYWKGANSRCDFCLSFYSREKRWDLVEGAKRTLPSCMFAGFHRQRKAGISR